MLRVAPADSAPGHSFVWASARQLSGNELGMSSGWAVAHLARMKRFFVILSKMPMS